MFDVASGLARLILYEYFPKKSDLSGYSLVFGNPLISGTSLF
jgi:hypothetical protein